MFVHDFDKAFHPDFQSHSHSFLFQPCLTKMFAIKFTLFSRPVTLTIGIRKYITMCAQVLLYAETKADETRV